MPKLFTETGLRWLWLALLALVLDQASKLSIVAKFRLGESLEILPFFNFTYAHNYGAAFSMFSDAGGWQRWFFTTIALGVSAMILVWLKQTKKHQILLPVAFSLILGGALGNLYDRLAYGYVVDFLHVYYQSWHFPIFNIADSAICLGAGLLIYDAIFSKESSKSEE